MASNTYNPERHLNNNKEFVKTYKNPFVMKDVRDVLVANNNGVVIRLLARSPTFVELLSS